MIEATPVPVTPPQVPPRPTLWVVIEPPTESTNPRRKWYWLAYPDIYDTEQAAQEYANEKPGSVIFRLAGSGEVGK